MSEGVILVVDDDDDIRMFLDVTLKLAGYEVVQATDGEEGLQKAIDANPALVLMDVMMPKMDGVTAVRRLRLDGRTSHLPIIVLTAKAHADDKIVGLAAGADDYITKPFDPDELIARVQSTLRRAQQMRSVSPLTGLPGNTRIEQELHRRTSSGEAFGLLYADLNHFKAYNDQYGFMKGDEVIRTTASVIVDAVARFGDGEVFVGHIGGDDFVVVCAVEQVESIATSICSLLDERIKGHYDPEDLARGYIEVRDRRGDLQRYPPVSISIGITTSVGRTFSHHSQPVALATEMKSFAKKSAQEAKSNFAIDRRTDVDRGNRPQ